MAEIHEQLENMQRQIDLLEARLRGIESYSHLPKKAIVGADYVMSLFGCTKSAAGRGRASYGTIVLRNKRGRFNPDGWLKEDVDAAHKEFIKTAPQRAMEAERAAHQRSEKRRAK